MLTLIQNLASSPVLMETLQDDFSTGSAPDTTRWPSTSGGTFVSLTGGACVITSGSGAVYSVVQSASIYTITNSYLMARVTPATPAGTNLSQQTYLSVDKDDNNWIGIYRDGSTLYWQKRQAGVDTVTAIGTYNATTMAWWRVRHDGTGFRLGYSSDGVTWTETAAQTVTWTITGAMRATLMVGKWDASDPAATGTYDNINIIPASAVVPDEFASLDVLSDNPSITEADAANPDELVSLDAIQDQPTVSSDSAASPDEFGALTVAQDNPQADFAYSTAPDELTALTVAQDQPTVSSDSAAAPDELAALSAAQDAPSVTSDSTTSPDELTALTVNLDGPSGDVTATAAPDELVSLDVAQDNPDTTPVQDADPDELTLLDVALDAPAVAVADTTTQADDGPQVDIVSDSPDASLFTTDPAQPDDLAVDVSFDDPQANFDGPTGPGDLGIDLFAGTPDITINDTAASVDGDLALPVTTDDPIAGEIDGTYPNDDITLGVTADGPSADFTTDPATPGDLAVDITLDDPAIDMALGVGPDPLGLDLFSDGPDVRITAGPDEQPAVPVALDNPTVVWTAHVKPSGVGIGVAANIKLRAAVIITVADGPNVTVTQDPPSTAMLAQPDSLAVPATIGDPATDAGAASSVGAGPALPVTQDPVTSTFGALVTPPDLFSVPVALDAPTFHFQPNNTTAAPQGLHILTTTGEPAQPDLAGTESVITPIVSPRYIAPTLPYHQLGIGPWNSSVVWRAAPNYGLKRGQRASVPHLTLPNADSKTVTLRLNAASEATTTHTFSRETAVIIQENFTDLWWRRRDPRRAVIDQLGRFNAATVDVSLETSGVTTVSASYTDYQGLLEDRLIMQYLNPGHTPPDIMWNTGTLITDILRWCIPTNLGIDLTGIQALTPDITATIKTPYQIPLGTPLSDVFTQLQGLSTAPWEWWVDTPASDIDRPRLTLATARGADRGASLISVGGRGPIASASLQRNGDKYANALYFIGNQGGVVVTLDDQVALNGERDATFSDDKVLATVDVSGTPYLLNAAAEKKLAELAAATPSYQVVLRPGYWEGRTHIDVGDWVNLRLAFGADIISGKWRVSEIQIDIDAGGFETVTLTLGTPRSAKDPRSRKSSTARIVRYLANYTVPEGA